MDNRGMSTVADLIFMAVLVSTSCCILIHGNPSGISQPTEGYVGRTAQNTLLAMQKIPVEKISGFRYEGNLPPYFISSERNLDEKTLSELIKIDVLYSPEWNGDEILEDSDGNRSFTKELTRVLENFLDTYVGDRYCYRLNIRLEPVTLSWTKELNYERDIEKIENDSRKLYSETVTLNFSVPKEWRSTKDLEMPAGKKIYNWNKNSVSENYFRELPTVQNREQYLENMQEVYSIFGKYGSLKVSLKLWSK